MSHLEQQLLFEILAEGLPHPKLQYRFALDVIGDKKGIRDRLQQAGLKDWRFDMAWPDYKLAVEVEGGTFVNGGHNRGKYYSDNCRKYNEATLMGWRVLRFTTDQVGSGYASATVARCLRAAGVVKSI